VLGKSLGSIVTALVNAAVEIQTAGTASLLPIQHHVDEMKAARQSECIEGAGRVTAVSPLRGCSAEPLV
jgi:hypothetical protein